MRADDSGNLVSMENREVVVPDADTKYLAGESLVYALIVAWDLDSKCSRGHSQPGQIFLRKDRPNPSNSCRSSCRNLIAQPVSSNIFPVQESTGNFVVQVHASRGRSPKGLLWRNMFLVACWTSGRHWHFNRTRA